MEVLPLGCRVLYAHSSVRVFVVAPGTVFRGWVCSGWCVFSKKVTVREKKTFSAIFRLVCPQAIPERNDAKMSRGVLTT